MIQEAPDFIGDSETAAEPGLPVLLPLREQEARRCISPLPVPAPGGYPQASFFSISVSPARREGASEVPALPCRSDILDLRRLPVNAFTGDELQTGFVEPPAVFFHLNHHLEHVDRIETGNRSLNSRAVPQLFLLEITLFRTANGAHPILGQILEFRPGSDPVVGVAFYRVINVTADGTYVPVHLTTSRNFLQSRKKDAAASSGSLRTFRKAGSNSCGAGPYRIDHAIPAGKAAAKYTV